MSLRAVTIRLAHAKPELREHLLPLLAKEAAYPQTDVVFRTTSGNWGGNAQNIAGGMIADGVPKPLRDSIMDALLKGGTPVVREAVLQKIISNLKKRNAVHRVAIPPSERKMTPGRAKDKLIALMNAWAKDAYKDWKADNPGRDIQEVAFDLGRSFLYEPEVEELMETAGLTRRQVENMAADRLPH